MAPIDKSSTVLTVLLAILLFHETGHLAVKLIGIALIGTGTYLMIEKKTVPGDAAGASKAGNRRWVIYAILSAVFAALTSILAKIGIAGVESNLATAIRTSVVLLMAWLIVIARGKVPLLRHLGWREGLFIALSGVATGASWLFYYYAIQTGAVSVVVPIDKMSILLTVFFSCVFLHEKLSRRGALGLSLMALGTLAMAIWA